MKLNRMKKSIIRLLLLIEDRFPSRGIPVLTYHQVVGGKEEANVAYVTEATFRCQMNFLFKSGYQTIKTEDVFKYVADKKELQTKKIVITFDDGFNDNLNAFRILKEYGFSGVIFISTAFIGGKYDYKPFQGKHREIEKKISKNEYRYLSVDDLMEIKNINNNNEICPHTHTHIALSSASYLEQEKEIEKANEIVSTIMQTVPVCMAYPYGDYNGDTIAILRKCGYKYAFSMNPGVNRMNDNPYILKRHSVSGEPDYEMFKLMLTDKYKYYLKIRNLFFTLFRFEI